MRHALIIAAFLVSGPTGVLTLLHLETALNAAAPDWPSCAIVLAGGAACGGDFPRHDGGLKRPVAPGVVRLFAGPPALSFLPVAGAGGCPAAVVMQGPGRAAAVQVLALTEEVGGAAVGCAAGPGRAPGAPLGGGRGTRSGILEPIFAP